MDLNCGCPANTVTGNGAGSSLLRTPALLHACVKAMAAAATGSGVPVSVKMRSGFLERPRWRLAGQIAMSRAAFFGRMKKIMRYIFGGEPELWKACDELLRAQPGAMSEDELVETMCGQVARHWAGTGPSQRMLFNHMSKEARVESTSIPVATGGALWLSRRRGQ